MGRPAPAAPQRRRVTPTGVPRWSPDEESPRFTIAVLADTQYLFDGEALHPEALRASLRHVLATQAEHNTVFLAHLGDVTQNGAEAEVACAAAEFDVLDRAGAPWSVLAGNHDVDGASDDRRGPTPWLRHFGGRGRAGGTLLAASPDGYSTVHRLRAAGRPWIVLALDWRTTAAARDTVRRVLAEHPAVPVVLTTHELVQADDGSGRATFSAHGEELWDDLVRPHDQVFLTLNGHSWPSGRTVRRNDAGHDVHLHVVNHQHRYGGGSGMLRLYRVDVARGTVDVETFSPHVLAQAPAQRNALAAQEVERTGDADRFSFPLDVATRFAGFAPVPARAARPAADVLVPGTLAHWRFAGEPGTALARDAVVPDASGRGNDLVPLRGTAGALVRCADHHRDAPTHGGLELRGDGLRTVDGAPLAAEEFPDGYTVEAFVRLPADFGEDDGWAGIVSRGGTAAAAGRGDGDPDEPPATLSLSPSREAQWCAYPTSSRTSVTNWSHELPPERWWHLAAVNDGRRTTLFVDGCPVVRNPVTANRGLATAGRPWLVGGVEHAGTLHRTLRATLGDVRIVGRALPVAEFLTGP
nr:LamG-like jellyroll fold domain-containing protein [Kineococcus siccus]